MVMIPGLGRQPYKERPVFGLFGLENGPEGDMMETYKLMQGGESGSGPD